MFATKRKKWLVVFVQAMVGPRLLGLDDLFTIKFPLLPVFTGTSFTGEGAAVDKASAAPYGCGWGFVGLP